MHDLEKIREHLAEIVELHGFKAKTSMHRFASKSVFVYAGKSQIAYCGLHKSRYILTHGIHYNGKLELADPDCFKKFEDWVKSLNASSA